MKTVYTKLATVFLVAILVVGGGFMAHDLIGQDGTFDANLSESSYSGEPSLKNDSTNKPTPENTSDVKSSLDYDLRISKGVGAFVALIGGFTIDGVCVYPDDYAGGYFDDDGYLIILTTRRNSDEISFKSTNPLITENVIYKYAPHSYNSLKSLQAFLNAYMGNLSDLGINYTGILDNRNILEIGLSDLKTTDKVITLLKSNFGEFDESMVSFVQHSGCVTSPGMISQSEVN